MEKAVIFEIFEGNDVENENIGMDLNVHEGDDYDEEEDEEELIENPDGTMTIKIPEKKEKQIKVEHLCAKCSLQFPTQAVCSFSNHIN